MKLKSIPLLLLLSALMVLVACGGASEPTPDIEATVEARLAEARIEATVSAKLEEEIAADAAATATAEAIARASVHATATAYRPPSATRTSAPVATPTPTARVVEKEVVTATPTATPTPTLRATPTPEACVDERDDTVPLAWISKDLVATEETSGIGAHGFPQAWHSFAMEATFNNPYDISTKEWNFGFFFHACGSTSDAIVLTSVGKWSHTLIDGISDPVLNFETIDEGTFAASLLDTHTYGAQTLRLTVKDNTGIFYVNGTKIADIRVSSSPRGSALGVGTCIFDNQCTRPEATTRVTDFKASPL
jgi:hypothetical protein